MKIHGEDIERQKFMERHRVTTIHGESCKYVETRKSVENMTLSRNTGICRKHENQQKKSMNNENSAKRITIDTEIMKFDKSTLSHTHKKTSLS